MQDDAVEIYLHFGYAASFGIIRPLMPLVFLFPKRALTAYMLFQDETEILAPSTNPLRLDPALPLGVRVSNILQHRIGNYNGEIHWSKVKHIALLSMDMMVSMIEQA